MSRNKQRQRAKAATLERAYQTGRAYNSLGIQGNAYGGGNTSVTIPASILAQMLQNMAPQKNQAKDFAPGSPLIPYEGVIPKMGPRTFNVPVAININPNDRTLGNRDTPSFAQLRSFAQLYEGVSLCERVILDMIPKLTPHITLRKDLAESGASEKDYPTEIKKWQAFVEMPDPDQQMDIHSWLRMAWTEQTQIDALALYRQQSRGGSLYGLQIIDGTTIKPIVTERGTLPLPPYTAFQQYPYGIPGPEFTRDQMLYYRESPRAFTPYGFSRIERIMTRVNQALRKEQKDLAWFTDGNIPQGMIEVPDSSMWTPDQIDAYEQAWNALIAGNQQQQVRIKFTQPGMKYTQFDQYEQNGHLTEFDEFLLNVAVASYGLSMGDIGFTEDIHKSSGDSQQNMMYRRTLEPLVAVYASLFTRILSAAFHDDRFVVTFGGYEETEDLQTQAAAYSQFATVGAISPAGIARRMKFPGIPETGPLLITKDGVTPLANYEEGSDFRSASDAAQLAGLQQAAQPPQPQPTSQQAPGQGNSDTTASNLESAMSAAEKSASTPASQAARSSTESLMLERVTAMLARVERLLGERETVARLDPVHGAGGRFGATGGTPPATPTPTGHHGHHKGKTVSKAKLVARMQRLAARYAALAARARTSVQQNAAQQIAHAFTQIAQGLSAGTDVSAAMSTVVSQTVALSGGHNARAVGAMQTLFGTMQAALKAGIVRALAVDDDEDSEDEDDEAWLDELEQEVCTDEQESSQDTERHQNMWRNAARDVGRGDSQIAAGEEGPRVTQPVALRADLHTALDSRLSDAEYRRWRERAIADVKAGKAFRSFTTDVIPAPVHEWISDELELCDSVVGVKSVFARAKQMQAPPPLESEIIGAQPLLVYDAKKDIWEPDDTEEQLQAWRARGVQRFTWHTHVSTTGVCAICTPNDGVTHEVGVPFPSGHRIPSCHDHCQCSLEPAKEREEVHV